MEGLDAIGSIVGQKKEVFPRSRSRVETILLPLASILSAILLSLSFPLYNLSFLAWFCLAPLLYVLRQTGLFSAALLGFLFGYSFGLTAFSWFVAMGKVDYLQWLLLFIPVLSIYFIVFGAAYNLCSRYIGGWVILAAPFLWAALEYVRASLSFLACSGNLLGHTQYLHPLFIQISDITGVFGISFLILLTNQFISQVPEIMADYRNKKEISIKKHPPSTRFAWHLALVLLCFIGTISYGYFTMSGTGSGESLRVALVQGNVLTKDNMSYKEQVKHLQPYKKLSLEAAESDPDLIIWPSASLPAPINYSRAVRVILERIARGTQAFLLVGGAGYEKFSTTKKGYLPYSNSEFLISPDGELLGQYNKMKLLPFNEYLPFQGTFSWPRWITSLSESFVAGTEFTLFRVADAKFGAPICWENYFADHFRRFVKKGANFMVSPTNDAFYGWNAGPYQALVNNIFRAVENRVNVARVSSTGVTCFINPNGEVTDRVRDQNGEDLFVPGVVVRDVPLYERKSFYTLHGDIFSYGAIGVSIFFISCALYRSKKNVPERK